MNEEQYKLEIDRLNAELEKLRNLNQDSAVEKKKDYWIKLISSVLLPLTIALSGYWFSQAIKTKELQYNAKEAHEHDSLENVHNQQQLKLSVQSQRLETYKIITPLLETLAGADAQRRSYATNVILEIMPEEGPLILNIGKNSDPANAKAYQKKLDSKQDVLVAGIFSADPSFRTSSANEIMVNWYKTSGIVDALLTYASTHMDNANGIFNTVVVLQNMNGRVLKIKQQDIQTFLKQVIGMKNMDKTKQNARALSVAITQL
jgi:hypothetical protein